MTAVQPTRASGHESTAEPTMNHRVTARIIRDDGGQLHTVYHLDGQPYASIDAVAAELGDSR